jgi:hypothetical protein
MFRWLHLVPYLRVTGLLTQACDIAQWRVAKQAALLAAELRGALKTEMMAEGGCAYICFCREVIDTQ